MSDATRAEDLEVCLCHGCGQTCDVRVSAHQCVRCGAPLHRRKINSIARGWAFLFAALIFYIPANVLPVMRTEMLGQGSDSTIGGGVLEFWEAGAWDIALIIFIASIGVPAIKFFSLALLLTTAQCRSNWARRQRSQLFRFVELIGYWSMLDVMVVALVAALVQLHGLGTIEPRPGILFFGLVVVLTMFSAMSFDPRLIWDSQPQQGERSDGA
ncbi:MULTISPECIES: paraquat-inducible protein A [Pseudomonas]|uniref:Paraquat-inducible protein A n=1 Tax=Pseudomonas putida TaxID=303 RepID=A0A8I1ECX0_PSEPU|nr:paraquat-inducible protein A [Pseudomonas putida]MBI6883475.1 paraquat-inducible protein A [Pseudomonas putida]